MKHKHKVLLLLVLLIFSFPAVGGLKALAAVTLISQIQATYLVQQAKKKLRVKDEKGASSNFWHTLYLSPSNTEALAYLGILCPESTFRLIRKQPGHEKNLQSQSQLKRISKLPLWMRQYNASDIEKDDKGRYLLIEGIKVYELDWDRANLINIEANSLSNLL